MCQKTRRQGKVAAGLSGRKETGAGGSGDGNGNSRKSKETRHVKCSEDRTWKVKRLQWVPYGPTAPEPTPPSSAPRHRAHQRPSAAGLRPGRAQEEAFSVLAHLQQAHPFQKMKTEGLHFRCGGCEEGLSVSSILNPRTERWTRCWKLLLGMNEE